MYFKMLPDLNYLKYDKNPYQGEIFRVKNLFTRAVFSKFVEKYVTIFDTYIIKDGDRADTIAYNLYENSYYDWVIILCNERLINYFDEWPKQATSLEQYVLQKYGTKAYDIHHYETLEVRNSENIVLLPSGLQVDQSFSFNYTDNGVTIIKSGSQIKLPVTNYDYEFNLNEKKRAIQLLKPQYLTLFENEIKNIYSYNVKSPNVISNFLKTTENDIFPII